MLCGSLKCINEHKAFHTKSEMGRLIFKQKSWMVGIGMQRHVNVIMNSSCERRQLCLVARKKTLCSESLMCNCAHCLHRSSCCLGNIFRA